MNELIMLFVGMFIGTVCTLGVLSFYKWLDALSHRVQYLRDERRYLIRETELMNEFLFWKNEQKKK